MKLRKYFSETELEIEWGVGIYSHNGEKKAEFSDKFKYMISHLLDKF